MSKSEDKMVKQCDQDSQEQTENKECLLGNRESHPLSPPTGGYVSLSYPTPDFAKQSDTDLAGYMSLISEYYRNPILVQGIILSSGR
jgi:hypothetical protein